MSELGISVYLKEDNLDENITYIKKAAELGFTRLFTSMLEIVGEPDQHIAGFKKLIDVANKVGMKTTVDINPALFDELGIKYDDLSFFKELGAWAIRLDEGFTGLEETQMTHNPLGLKIETNISRGGHYIESVMDYSPNRDALIGSHNFYPQKYTGLDKDYFNGTAGLYKSYNLQTSAFVSAPSATQGPWPVSDGLVSLEDHRNLPLATQVQWMKFNPNIDNIFIGNAHASDEELEEAATAFKRTMPLLHVLKNGEPTELETKIVEGKNQLYRGDRSSYVIRSTQSRVDYKNEPLAPRNTETVNQYDVLIANENYGQYKAELQIAIKPLENDGRMNVVGRIHPDDIILISEINPWSSFQLKFV
ncbi:MAG: MupG family TIM beta-alpha barrel fold protein [Lactobacillaceae bacterium]|jgi:hypothetical protein|nr:MupG family TIM beta-alpha barrel fold protein [Lactobacillaceae bacterium]